MKIRALFIVPILIVGLVSCSGGDSKNSSATADTKAPTTDAEVPVTDAPTTTVFAPEPVAMNDVGETTVEGPVTGGGGQIIFGTSAFDGPAYGYTEEEYFISGTANSYTSDQPLNEDGMWNVTPKDTAEYKTRILVRRPVTASEFSGTVYVEWLNVTAGLDTGPTWSLSWVEMLR